MKKILVISNMYPNKWRRNYGIFVKNQVEALRKRGFIVDVLAIKDPRKGIFQLLKKYFFWGIKGFFILGTKGRTYDVIHAHYVFPSGFLALMFKRFFQSKVVITAHGGDMNQMPNKGNFMKRQTKKILHKADEVIAVGEQLKQDMIDIFHVPREKITVLNMGVNREVFAPKSSEISKTALQLQKEYFHLLFVGNLIKEKGIVDLIEAYILLKPKYPFIQLHILGAIVDKTFYTSLIKKIKEEKIDGITFHSPKSQQTLATWMQAADAFILPSHTEGFGLVALEAMSTHTPVLGTKVGGLKYLLKDGAGIIVEKNNPSSLARGIERIVTDHSLRKALIQKGEKRAEENREEVIIDHLITLYAKNRNVKNRKETL